MKTILFIIYITCLGSISYSQEKAANNFNISVFRNDADFLLESVSKHVDQSQRPEVILQELAIVDSAGNSTDATRLFYILGPLKNQKTADPIFGGVYIELYTGEIKTALLMRDPNSKIVTPLGDSAMIFLNPKIYEQGGNQKVKEAADEAISILQASNPKYKFVPRYNLGIVSALKTSDSQVYSISDKLTLIQTALALPSVDPNPETHLFFNSIYVFASGSVIEAKGIDLSATESVDLDSLRVLNSKLISDGHLKTGFISKYDSRYTSKSACSGLFTDRLFLP